MARTSAKQKVLAEALERFQIIESAESDDRDKGVEDIRFAQTDDGQWDELAATARNGRPRYTLNKVAAAIDTIIGDQRQNEISASVVALTDDADMAETYDGIIRNIEAQSSAKNIYDSAFDEQLNSGRGGWRVVTQFADDDVFEQEIRLEPIRSATTSLWFDLDALQYDKRDAGHAFLTWHLTVAAFKRKYPKATITSFTDKRYGQGSCKSWFKADTVRMAEYWRKVPVNITIVQLSDGTVTELKKVTPILDDLLLKGITVVKTRKATGHKIERYVMNGAEVLEGPDAWAGKYIPLIPLYGKINHIEDKTHVRGLVRFAKDAQRIYNYVRSALVEITALTPKDPYWITAEQAKGHTDKLARLATDNPPFQQYNADPDAPGIPARSGAPQVQQAMIEQGQTANLDITQTLGVTAGTAQPTAGTDLDLRSGKAIEAQARRGDAGAFVFADNLVKSMEYSAVVLVDLIPKIMDTEQATRILQPDGTDEIVMINQTVIDQGEGGTGLPVKINDLTTGKYDVKAKTGPMFATQREKAASELKDLAISNPVFADATPDLIAKSLDTPMADELHKRIRKVMIQQGKVEPTEEESEEMNVEQLKEEALIAKLVPQITQELEQSANIRLLNAEAAKREAEVADIGAKTSATVDKNTADANESELNANKIANETMGIMLENIATQLDMGLPLTEVMQTLAIGQQQLIFLSQQEIGQGEQAAQQQSQQQQLQQALLTLQA